MNNKELNEVKSLISHAINSVMAARAMEISQASDPEAVEGAEAILEVIKDEHHKRD